MRRFLAALALVLSFAAVGSAQTIVGGTGGATFIISDGDVTNVGSILGEIEYQFPWSEYETGRSWGGLLGYVGLNSEGGGTQTGLGYRHYIRAGNVYPGFGFGGFALGESTPGVNELTIFAGAELVLEVPLGEEDDDQVTGFVGVYPSISGQDDLMVVRGGIRAALN